MSGANHPTPETKSCPRCDGRGRIEPFWPVGPGGARLDDHKCSTCGGTGIVTISPPVMNSPADEAEARDRAHGAPRQADPAAPGRGESGLTSGSEARPVTPTAHHLSSNTRNLCKHWIAETGHLNSHAIAWQPCPWCEIDRLTHLNGEMRNQARLATEGWQEVTQLRAALEESVAMLHRIATFPMGQSIPGNEVESVIRRGREALSGEPGSGHETFAHPSPRQIVFNWLMAEPDFAIKKDGWWSGHEDVERIDALLAALGLPQPPLNGSEPRDGER